MVILFLPFFRLENQGSGSLRNQFAIKAFAVLWVICPQKLLLHNSPVTCLLINRYSPYFSLIAHASWRNRFYVSVCMNVCGQIKPALPLWREWMFVPISLYAPVLSKVPVDYSCTLVCPKLPGKQSPH